MKTETLAANLRNAISSGDSYHIELYGEEACRRLVQQKDALDALQAQRDAARAAVMEKRDTEPVADDSACETAIRTENNWLRDEWLRLFDVLNVGDAERVLDIEYEGAPAPSEAAIDALTPKPTPDMEENPERETELQQLAKERDWLYNEWLRVLDELGYGEDAERIIDRDDDSADAPSTVVLDELWKQRVTTTALCSEVARMEPAKEPEPESERKCRTCKWYVPEQLRCDIGWDGECHRYPDWITRVDADWCGEWEERPFRCEERA